MSVVRIGPRPAVPSLLAVAVACAPGWIDDSDRGDPGAAANVDPVAESEPPPADWRDLPSTNPNTVLPDLSVLVPEGQRYADVVPDTLDLADLAQAYLQGMSNSLMSGHFFAPPGHIVFFAEPHQEYQGGVPNWGKSAHAMILARRMSGYDLDDHDGTLNVQLQSLRNMLDANVNRNFIDNGEGAWIVIPLRDNILPMTTALEALLELARQDDSAELDLLIRRMVSFHLEGGTALSQNGEPMYYYGRIAPADLEDLSDSFVGIPGRYLQPYVSGKTMRALSTWYGRTGDGAVLNIVNTLSSFTRNFEGNFFWQPLGDVPAGYGHFAGHMHGYANALMGLLWQAEARLHLDPSDQLAMAIVALVNDSYLFIRDYRGAGVLGNFGEICTVGDMLRLAAKLTDLGVADYFGDIDRWLRNTIAESQIRENPLIRNYVHPENDLLHLIGSRAVGLFYEDAAHPFAIPNDPSTEGVNAFQLVACGFGNVMMGVYDAWAHIVQFKGTFAQINLLLNRATPYLDVKSELPYRGVVHIVTKADLGPVHSIGVRVPEWADRSRVQVSRDGQDLSGQWFWVAGSYVQVDGVVPNADYVVSFPMVVRQLTITQIKGQDQMWNESNWAGPSHPFQTTSYTGTFRGNTLVDVDHRPSGGTQLYQRQALAQLPATDVDAPWRSTIRFAPLVP